jgi:hypothetical protein
MMINSPYQVGPLSIMKRWAVLMPDGELERCPFDDTADGKGKVVFDDLDSARRAGSLIGALPGHAKLTPYPCRIWDHVWHLSSRPDGVGPEGKRTERRIRRLPPVRPLTHRLEIRLMTHD